MIMMLKERFSTIFRKLKQEISICSFPELLVKILELILRTIQIPLKMILLGFVLFFSLCIYLGTLITKDVQYRDICVKMIKEVICNNCITLIEYKK